MCQTFNGRLSNGTAVAVRVQADRIESVAPTTASDDLPLLAPPLVDLQQNGALGIDFSNLPDDPEPGLRQIAACVRTHGVGRMLATLITIDLNTAERSLRLLDRCLKANPDLDRLIAGVFYEGNFISPDDGWRGCHDPQFIRDPDWDDWRRLQDASGGRIRVFNLDPSRPNALATIRKAVDAGLRVSMGHCSPDPDTIRAAIDAGADLVTHFGNGMPPRIHRHQNPLWTWLAEPRLTVSLIADGLHLPGDLLRAVFAAKGRDHAYLVSDASSLSGLPAGAYGDVAIEADGFCHVKGQEILAGAWHQLDRGVERLCELGWSLDAAWRQACELPARILRLPLPRIAAGEPAEFVLARYQPETGLSILKHVQPDK